MTGTRVEADSEHSIRRDAGSALARVTYIIREGLRGFCRSNRVPTAMASLCFALAIATFVALISSAAGASRDGAVALTHFGGDRITVHGFSRGPMVAPIDFDLEDIRAVMRHIPNVRIAHPERQWRETVSYGDRATAGYIVATDVPEHEQLTRGVWYTPNDGREFEAVVVIGSALKGDLFDRDADPVGEFLRIGGQPFLVKGVLDDDSRMASAVYMPYQSAMAFLDDPPPLSMGVLVENAERIEASALAIKALLKGRHGREGFTISTDAGSIHGWKTMRGIFNGILLCIGVFGALVGATGVCAVVLLSVRRRTKEIGIRMAMGAGRSHIALQFLVEAMITAMVGCLVGVVLAAFFCSVLIRLHVPVDFEAWQLGTAVTGTTLVGLLAGVLPAYRASRLDPSNALGND